jgi:hypothetical protein
MTEDTDRLKWERVERFIELTIRAIGLIAELLDALARIIH